MADVVRWKYCIIVKETRRGTIHGVKAHKARKPGDPWLFKGEPDAGSEAAKLWIEEKEFEGGYAKRRPRPGRT